MATTIGFIKRSPNDLLNKIIYQLRVKVSLFNVKIQLANGASLEAHAIVLAMYSKYFRLLLGASAPDAKFIVCLQQFTSTVMECVLDLFYNGQIFLAGSLKSQVLKALTFLDVEYMPLNTHMQLRQPTITKRRNSYSGVNTLAESDETEKDEELTNLPEPIQLPEQVRKVMASKVSNPQIQRVKNMDIPKKPIAPKLQQAVNPQRHVVQRNVALPADNTPMDTIAKESTADEDVLMKDFSFTAKTVGASWLEQEPAFNQQKVNEPTTKVLKVPTKEANNDSNQLLPVNITENADVNGPSTAFNKATEKLTNSDVSTTGLNYNFVETDMEFSEKFGEIIDDIDMDELLLEMNNNTPSLT